MDRREIEERARAESLVRDELARRDALMAELAELAPRAGIARRATAALAGSRLAGLLARYGAARRLGTRGSEAERRGAELRRRRFRLSRRKRVLERGLGGLRVGRRERRPLPPARGGNRGDDPAASFRIRIAGRDWESARYGGDAALAGSLARALGERGQRAVVHLSAEAAEGPDDGVEVELTLRGRAAGDPTPGRLNLLWLISHPDEVGVEEMNRYDRVLVASRRHAEQLDRLVTPPVETLLQFTDPRLFRPDPDPERAHQLLFVGNWRGEFRRIVWDALETGHRPALYGRGWDLLAPEQAVAEHVPHDELHRLYSSCEVLLCDHWDDMRRHGFVSNRIFDALACEAFAIADDNPAIVEELPGAVETYSSQEELGEKLRRYLDDPLARHRMARRGRELVLAEHTVERRAEELLAIAASARAAAGGSAAGTAWREADAESE